MKKGSSTTQDSSLTSGLVEVARENPKTAAATLLVAGVGACLFLYRVLSRGNISVGRDGIKKDNSGACSDGAIATGKSKIITKASKGGTASSRNAKASGESVIETIAEGVQKKKGRRK